MPELSLTTLTWINGALFALYLPMGFMGWAFAAGAYANSPNDTARQQRWVLAAAIAPALVILGATVAPHWLPEPWSLRLAWVPLGVVACFLALVFGGAIVSGFMAGVREGSRDPDASEEPKP